MQLKMKKLIFSAMFNISLFLLLIIGIQNSSSSKKVNLLISETINLPVSFIIGISFIGGSITSSILLINSQKDEE
jgi:uncharacterized integral membrane protein